MTDVETRIVESSWTGRAVGLLQVLGGALEGAGGIGLLLVPEPTFLTKAGGTVLLAKSADDITAGLYSIWSGAVQESLTKQAATAAALQLGASDKTAHRAGTAVDIATGVGPSLVTQTARYTAIRAGQQATDSVAIAWVNHGWTQLGHNSVGVTQASKTKWFELAGNTQREGGVRFVLTFPPQGGKGALGYHITRLAVPPSGAARALMAAERLKAKNPQTWSLLGNNCTTTASHVLQQAGVAIPAWARSPAALHFGVRHGYAITAVGSASVGGVVSHTSQRGPRKH